MCRMRTNKQQQDYIKWKDFFSSEYFPKLNLDKRLNAISWLTDKRKCNEVKIAQSILKRPDRLINKW